MEQGVGEKEIEDIKWGGCEWDLWTCVASELLDSEGC